MILRAKLVGIDEALHGLVQAIDAEVDRALDLIGARVADEAKASHPYQDRTGDLTDSIQAQPAYGRVSEGTALVDVVALAEYSGYVEAKVGAILQPAFDRTENELDAMLVEALQHAAQIAGW